MSDKPVEIAERWRGMYSRAKLPITIQLIEELSAAEARVRELEAWKQEQLQVESTWEGKRVRRKGYEKGSYFKAAPGDFIKYWSQPLGRKMEDIMQIEDLLADDWEIAE